MQFNIEVPNLFLMITHLTTSLAYSHLTLMMLYKLNDILFFVKQLKEPNSAFNVHNVTFSSNHTRSASHHNKLARTNVTKTSFLSFVEHSPPIDLNLSYMSIKHILKQLFWNHFINNFNPNNPCTLDFLCPSHKCVCTKGHSFKP